MQDQNLKNHPRLIPGFHMLTSALTVASLVYAILMIVHTGLNNLSIYMVLVSLVLVLQFIYTRQFATGNQDRIIRAEENFRCYRLTGKPLDERLTRGQIIGLRFADDDEYAALSDRAIKENLSQADIKKAVTTWRADHHRI